MDTIIIGAGGHGKVVLDALLSENRHRVVGFVDADAQLHGTQMAGIPVLGGINQLTRLRQQKVRHAIVAIGDNRIRQQYAREAIAAGLELITCTHPQATVARSATIGRNVFIAAGAVVCPDVWIGDSTIVNTSAVVDHECWIGEAVHIAPGALLAGRVRVEEGVFVGMGAKVIQCLTLGAGAVIGAGAVVLHDLAAGCTAVGVPARVIKG